MIQVPPTFIVRHVRRLEDEHDLIRAHRMRGDLARAGLQAAVGIRLYNRWHTVHLELTSTLKLTHAKGETIPHSRLLGIAHPEFHVIERHITAAVLWLQRET